MNKTDVFVTFEMIYRFFTANLKCAEYEGELKSTISNLANTYISTYKPSRTHLKKHRIIQNLRRNKDIVILKPDKGNAVVMDSIIYDKEILKLIADPGKFRKLDCDPTKTRQTKLQNLLLKLKKRGLFSDDVYLKIYPVGSQPARIYGLPKIHKMKCENDIPKFRPIISSIGTYNYQLAKWLSDLLTDHLPNEYTSQDTFSFITDLKKQDLKGKYMVSFDVASLFTNIPLVETVDLAVDLIFTKYPELKVSRRDLFNLFMCATAETHFLFRGDVYDQIDGVAMGSPLGPVLANLFMGHHEKIWLENYNSGTVHFYRRYVDDIFAVFDNKSDADSFFHYLNLQHPNIKFTQEAEVSQCLSFLDVLVDNSNGLKTSVFRKKTFTGLLTSFESFTAQSYKFGLIKNLLFRAYSISTSWSIFHDELTRIFKILSKNSFPGHVIDKVTAKFIGDRVTTSPSSSKLNDQNKPEVRYYKLPYRGKFSEKAQTKLNAIAEKLCKNIRSKLVFNPCKIGSFFTNKDPLPSKWKSWVVYKFDCAGCNSRYIGETTTHFATRMDQHFRKEKGASAIYKHLHGKNNKKCLRVNNNDSFDIIDHARTRFGLKLKEALHIKWNEPHLDLNKQVRHEVINITV